MRNISTLIINTPMKESDIEQQEIIIKAYNNIANIYENKCDYRTAYELHIKALTLCEKMNFTSLKPWIYNNLGLIYNQFNRFDIAKEYYTKSLNLCKDSAMMALIFNNLGDNTVCRDIIDSAFYYLNHSLQISKRQKNVYLDMIFNTIAESYQKIKLYDSAFYYFHLSLNESIKKNNLFIESYNLSKLGSLFLEVNKIDSALYYIDLSNIVAEENNFLRILADNYLILSEIEKSKKEYEKALNHYIIYTSLKDSIFNSGVFGDINQMQRLYEVSKTDQQIEELVIDRQIKENTIRYQRIIWYITLGVLILVTFVLSFILYQKKKLKNAYKILVEKNIEIIELQDNTTEKEQKKSRKNALTNKVQNELLTKILNVMKDTTVICDCEFTVDKLAKLVQSNQLYVSTAINDGLNTNFRSMLNSYRIKETQRLFSELDFTKYTVESVSQQVGFKSPSAFRNVFKEITGVTPTFYLHQSRKK